MSSRLYMPRCPVCGPLAPPTTYEAAWRECDNHIHVDQMPAASHKAQPIPVHSDHPVKGTRS